MAEQVPPFLTIPHVYYLTSLVCAFVSSHGEGCPSTVAGHGCAPSHSVLKNLVRSHGLTQQLSSRVRVQEGLHLFTYYLFTVFCS